MVYNCTCPEGYVTDARNGTICKGALTGSKSDIHSLCDAISRSQAYIKMSKFILFFYIKARKVNNKMCPWLNFYHYHLSLL